MRIRDGRYSERTIRRAGAYNLISRLSWHIYKVEEKLCRTPKSPAQRNRTGIYSTSSKSSSVFTVHAPKLATVLDRHGMSSLTTLVGIGVPAISRASRRK